MRRRQREFVDNREIELRPRIVLYVYATGMPNGHIRLRLVRFVKKIKDHALFPFAASNFYFSAGSHGKQPRPRVRRLSPRIYRSIFHVPRRQDFNAEIFIVLARSSSFMRVNQAKSTWWTFRVSYYNAIATPLVNIVDYQDVITMI